MKNNPYVGPRPYERADRHNFYGRDREARELLSLIVSERELLFCAQSGAGKTSLLNARVIPTLEEEGFWVLPVARVGSELPPGIDPAAVDNVFVFSTLLMLAGDDVAPQALVGRSLRDFLAAYCQDRGDASRLPILIFDQFEELFTTHRARWQDAHGFFEQVRQAMDVLPDLGLVFVMREDYLAALDPYLAFFPRRLQARFRMERLGPTGALAAVEKPAAGAGCPFAPGVARRLVDNLRRMKAVPIHTGAPNEAGAAASEVVLGPDVESVQLQVVCSRLWVNLPEQEDQLIQWEEVERYGNIDRALGDFYESALAAAVQAGGVSEQRLRRSFGEHFITPMGTRGLALRGAEETAGLPNAAVEILEGQHLIRAEMRAGTRWYELAHDRLVDPIVQSNRAWELARATPLRTAARRWQEAHDASLLYRDSALAEAQAWAESHPEEVESYEAEFLEASRQAERARTEVRRRRMTVMAGLLVALALMMVLALWAFTERDRAEEQREIAVTQVAISATAQADAERARADAEVAQAAAEDARGEAEQQALTALSRLLGMQVSNRIEEEPDVALLLGAHAYRIQETFEARNSLLIGLQYSPPAKILLSGPADIVHAVAFSPDERWLAAGDDAGSIVLWPFPFESADPITLTGHTDAVRSLDFSPDGATLASAGSDGTIRLWDVATGQLTMPPLSRHADEVFAVAFSPDGRQLASGSRDERVILWDTATGAVLHELRGHTNVVWSVAFSPDGRTLASSSEEIRLWDAETGVSLGEPFTRHSARVYSVAFSPDQQWLASGSRDGTLILWDITGARPEVVRRVTGWSHVSGIDFSSDGRTLVFNDLETATFLDPATGDLIDSSLVNPDNVSNYAFSPSGSYLAGGSAGPQVTLWEMRSDYAPGWVARGDNKLPAENLGFGPDNRTLIVAKECGEICHFELWDVVTRELLTESVDWNPQAYLLPVGSVDEEEEAEEPEVHPGVEALLNTLPQETAGDWQDWMLSSDGKLLAVIVETADGLSNAVFFWDVEADKPLAGPARGINNEPVTGMTFSPDGRYMAIWGDSCLFFWDVATRQRLGDYLLVMDDPTDRYWDNEYVARFSADSTYLAMLDKDGTPVVWSLDPEDWIAEACGIARRNLTPDEWEQIVGEDVPFTCVCPAWPCPEK